MGHGQGLTGTSPPVGAIDQVRDLLEVGVPIHHHGLRVCQLQWGQGIGQVIQPVDGRGQSLEGTQGRGTRVLGMALPHSARHRGIPRSRGCAPQEGPKVPHHPRSLFCPQAPSLWLAAAHKEGTLGPPHAGWQLLPNPNNLGGMSTSLQHPAHVPEGIGLPGVS